MSSPVFGEGEDSSLHKAKQMFLKHLEEVDTSEGLTNTLVVKFRLEPEVEDALNKFVEAHGCSMESRVLTREEQDKIDKRRKTCAQYTWFMVTPEAQEEYLKDRKAPLKRPSSAKATPKKVTPKKATPAKSARKPKDKTVKPVTKKETPESEDSNQFLLPAQREEDGDMLRIPRAKFDDLCARLADALLLLPTTDMVRGTECRDALVDVAHEMRELKSLKRPLDDAEEAGTSQSHRKAKRPRAH
ncbi:hypothetical protein C8R44DRAFT_974578 [Mycena epipterygia]|nr:hypothetical protein C8R44DRAFT_974578 [Mycena epipterygia]